MVCVALCGLETSGNGWEEGVERVGGGSGDAIGVALCGLWFVLCGLECRRSCNKSRSCCVVLCGLEPTHDDDDAVVVTSTSSLIVVGMKQAYVVGIGRFAF